MEYSFKCGAFKGIHTNGCGLPKVRACLREEKLSSVGDFPQSPPPPPPYSHSKCENSLMQNQYSQTCLKTKHV